MRPLLDYTVVDIETTGLNPCVDGITELAAVRVRNGEIVDQFQELVNPGVPIPHFLEEKTHITNAMVQSASPTCEVLARFLDFIGQDVLMGYNIDRFDKEFICEKVRCELQESFSPRTYDVFPMARHALKGFVRSFKLDSIREALGISGEGAHRALKDCCDTYRIYQKILSMPCSANDEEYNFTVSFCSCAELTPERQIEIERSAEVFRAKKREVMGWFPDRFKAIEKPYIPKNYKERWSYVRKHPFETLSGANVVITGSSESMPRTLAEDVVSMVGANLKQSTTRDCDFLIDLGNGGCTKYESARKWLQKGSPLRIILAEQFINLVHASIVEIPPSDDEVVALEREIADMREQFVMAERNLKKSIKDNLKKRISAEELHNWRQGFSILWNRILEDDVIEPQELEELREWLLNHMRKTTDYKSMFALMDEVIADGVVDYDESIRLFSEAEKCLYTMGAEKVEDLPADVDMVDA